MRFVDACKRRLHRDIAADPVLHARVLNLYLNGEEYPQRVQDYFPMAAAADMGLEGRMRQHLRDEEKHVALYRKAIASLGQAPTELPIGDVYNNVIWRRTPQAQGKDTAATLAHFMAHLHVLEARVARSLEYHVDACEHATSRYPAKAVGAILADEHRHAAYTREALFELAPVTRARDILALHQRAEARANVEFSARELRRLLVEEGARFSRTSRAMHAASVSLLSLGGAHG